MRGPLAVGLLIAALALAAAPARAAVPPGNLLANPGAEAAAGAADSSTPAPPPDWTVESTFSAVQYGASGFLTAADGTAVGGGANFFAGGPGNPLSAATQVVDVTGAQAEIDGGGVRASLSALLGGYASQTDAATVTATFLDSASVGIGTLKIGPVTPAERNSTTSLLPRSASGTLPAGTRRISVRIEAVRADGSYNDGYADNVSLTLGGGTPTFHKTVVVAPVSGTVLVKLPGSTSFVKLDGSQTIALGATFDTRRGKLQLSSVPKAGAAAQTASFYDGLFKVTQPGAITQLALVEALASCKRGRAAAAASKPKSRKLWGSGSGNFRTRGHYSAATVRGTTWLVQDTCAGTLTRVKQGSVLVRDTVRKKNIILRAGRSYLARP